MKPRKLSFLFCLIAFLGIPTQAAKKEKHSIESQTLWENLRKKARVRTFSEFMTPAFKHPTKPAAIPTPQGDVFAATNVFNIVWADYEVAPDLRLVYWQRFMVNLAPMEGSGLMAVNPRNPRFGLRKSEWFKTPNLSTTYDVYLQPGVAPEGKEQGRELEMGMRLNTAYTIPKSHINFGMVLEANLELIRGPQMTTPFYGWIMPWLSYDLNSTFSTQHVLSASFCRGQNTNGLLEWDTPMPYMQNGIGINLSQTTWLAFFMNNYLFEKPSASNSWASVWLALEIL